MPASSSVARWYQSPTTSASACTATGWPSYSFPDRKASRRSSGSASSAHAGSASSRGSRNPEDANSLTQTESISATSGARPSATAWTRTWCRSSSATGATLNAMPGGHASCTSSSQWPSGTTTRS